MTALDPDRLIAAGLLLATVVVLAGAALAGWNNWLALRRLQLTTRTTPDDTGHPATRIELADLKERVRRLEAIAAGVDL